MISVLREIEHLKKTPLVISKVVYTLMNDELLTYIIHTSALVYDDSQNLRAEFSQNACTHHETALFSDDSSERLWLANVFISSTDSCVNGCNTQHCKNAEKESWWNIEQI